MSNLTYQQLITDLVNIFNAMQSCFGADFIYRGTTVQEFQASLVYPENISDAVMNFEFQIGLAMPCNPSHINQRIAVLLSKQPYCPP
jgi:hypothetical protein